MSQPIKSVEAVGVFDLETTGIDLEAARTVTAYIGLMGRDGTIFPGKEKSWLVNPGIDIPVTASNIHGITTEHAVQHGLDAHIATVDIRRVLAQFIAAGIPIVAFNARYDFTVFDRECRRNGVQPLDMDNALVLDPHVLDKGVDKYRSGPRTLTATAAHYGIPLLDAHEASADAIAAGKLAYRLMGFLDQDATLADLHATQVNRAAEQAASLQQHKRKTDPHAYVESQWPMKLYGS